MKVSTEERQGLFRALKVEVEGDIVRSALDEVYNYLKQNAEIEGFRKGKAPLWIIRAKFRDYVQEEVGKKVANATLSAAIQESGLKPVADVYLESVQLEEPNQKLSYTVSFEVPPDFELQNIEGLEVEIKKVEFSEEMVAKRIEELREEHALWEPVDREVREGDLVMVEYKVQDLESRESTQGETSGVIGTNTFREEVEKALLGKKEGDTLTLEELALYNLRGEPVGKAKVELKIKSVKEKVLPELGDDFAKELGLGESWAEAQEKIRQEVKASLESVKKAMLAEATANKLVQIHNFEVPQTLLQREVALLVERRVNQLSQWGVDPKYVDYRALAKEVTPQAVFNIKLRFILEKYAREKGIQVSAQELQKRTEELAQSYEKSPEEVRDFLQKEELLPVLEGDLRREKALEDILSKVVVRELQEEEHESV
ncbi:MAG: trigger factor [Aquificaceae bacterium]|nr:trigger factor [Aquificaceae bacterium]